MEIKLTPTEEALVQQIATEMAQAKEITPEQALKDLLGIGIASWREMQLMTKMSSK